MDMFLSLLSALFQSIVVAYFLPVYAIAPQPVCANRRPGYSEPPEMFHIWMRQCND